MVVGEVRGERCKVRMGGDSGDDECWRGEAQLVVEIPSWRGDGRLVDADIYRLSHYLILPHNNSAAGVSSKCFRIRKLARILTRDHS